MSQVAPTARQISPRQRTSSRSLKRGVQQSLAGIPKQRLEHNPEKLRGRRKVFRPIDPARPIHLVLRSEKARGKWSMLADRNREYIDRQIRKRAKEYGVVVCGLTNVGNHLHLLVKTKSNRYWIGRAQFQNFLRRISGEIAMHVTGAKKGKRIAEPGGAASGKRAFWKTLAYTKIVHWGRHFDTLQAYLDKNIEDAAGLVRSWPKEIREYFMAVDYGGDG